MDADVLVCIQEIKREQEDIRKKVDKHENDLYYGNGKPGLTTRMANQEIYMGDVRKILFWIFGLTACTFLSVLGWMLANLVQSLKHF